MVSAISGGDSVIVPTLVNGFESARPVRSVVHEILNSSVDDVDLRPAGPRQGRMELLFASDEAEVESAAAESVLVAAGVFTFADEDRPTLEGLVFIPRPGGQITRTLDPDTRAVWLVAFEWCEVTQ